MFYSENTPYSAFIFKIRHFHVLCVFYLRYKASLAKKNTCHTGVPILENCHTRVPNVNFHSISRRH